MAKNDERKTTVKGFIIRLNTETMNTDVYPFTEQVKYTRTADRAAAFVSEKLGLDGDAMVKVTELVQSEYERRVYDAHTVWVTACGADRAYPLDNEGKPFDPIPEDIAALNRVTIDVYRYTITGLMQRKDGSYFTAKVCANGITECRAGIGSAQGYAMDVLNGKRAGWVKVWHFDGTTEEIDPQECESVRVAAWDSESKQRVCSRFACYLTDEELSKVPYTVYKRGEGNENADK